MNDTTTFGSFVNSFITLFRDDFAKLSILSIPFLSDSVFQAINTDDVCSQAYQSLVVVYAQVNPDHGYQEDSERRTLFT